MFSSNDLPSASRLSRKSEQRGTSVSSRCFRTEADGGIRLTTDWLHLLCEAHECIDRATIQTRHAYARMIATVPVPDFMPRPQSGWVSDPEGALHFNCESWASARARIAHCDCCGSPGRVEISNEHGLECVQICAMPECEPVVWAGFVANVLPEKVAAIPPTASVLKAPPPVFPRLPRDARWLRGDSDTIVSILSALGDENVPVSWTLRTGEFLHVREFSPKIVHELGGLLAIGFGSTSVQIGLPAVRALATNPTAHNRPLYLTGPDDTVLLTIAAASESEAAGAWRSAMRSAFPDQE